MNRHMSFILIIIILTFRSYIAGGQGKQFEYEKVPAGSGFKMEGYWVWGGSMIKVNSTYHLFASRWKKDGPFPEGYRKNSEIVRAISSSPLGPFEFKEVVIGERDSSFWDSDMAHNPTIHRIGNEYVIFYIGSDYTTLLSNTKNNLRRVGYAVAQSIEGPWLRSGEPVINVESNNPALLADESGFKLVFRDAPLRVYLAQAKDFRGPYKIINDNLWPDCKLEDFYMFRKDGMYHIICEDNVGAVSGSVRWGIHICSQNGIDDWKKYDPVVVYNHDIEFDDNSVLHCVRRERPQLLVENGYITHLITGVYDGNDSWCQPVKLKYPVKVED